MELTHGWNFAEEENDRLGRERIEEGIAAEVTEQQIHRFTCP